MATLFQLNVCHVNLISLSNSATTSTEKENREEGGREGQPTELRLMGRIQFIQIHFWKQFSPPVGFRAGFDLMWRVAKLYVGR